MLESIQYAETGGSELGEEEDQEQKGVDQVHQSSYPHPSVPQVLLYLAPQAREDFCTCFRQVQEDHGKEGFPVLC